jgi:hypothetical protein
MSLSCPPQPQLEQLVPQSQLMSNVVIDLRKPYAKTKEGESCIYMMFIDSYMVVDYGQSFLAMGSKYL